MIRPTGPLPPPVYWRRRAIALAVLVVAVMLLIWLVAAAAGAGNEGAAQPPGQPQPSTSSTMQLSFDERGGEAPPSDSATATAPAAASTTVLTAGPAVAPISAVAPAPPPPPPPIQPCPDPVIALVAQPQHPQYPVGAKPVFTLVVTNTGPVACLRDVDAGLQELLVLAADGVTRLWSSNDCYPGSGADVRTLQPGAGVTFRVTWAGRSSQPGCAGRRVPVPAGDYLVVAKLGALTSPPAPLRLSQP